MMRLISSRLVDHYVALHRTILAGIVLLFILTTITDITVSLLVDNHATYDLGGLVIRLMTRITIHAAAFALASAAIRQAFINMTASCREITPRDR